MTAPAIEIQTVEDIDLTPVCGDERHGESRPRADWWVDIHGCTDIFQCAPCHAGDMAEIKSWEWVRCTHCRQIYAAASFVTKVVPLR